MARLGNNGEVSISVGTSYDGTGMAQAKKDMEALSIRTRAEMEKGTSHLDRMRQAIEGMKAAWAELLVAYGAVRFLADAAGAALQAEIALNKLKFQVEATGVSWRAVSKDIEAAVASSARYGRVQKEEVMDSMRQLVWATGDYQKAIENLNLVQDLAYQTNMSTSEATRMVSMALTGNLEMLGRVKPEFRNLDEILGKHRTTVDEVAYFYAVMNEKVVGAIQPMTEHEKMVRDMNKTYSDLVQSLGWIVNVMNKWAYQILTMKPIMDDLADATQAFLNIYNALRYGEHTARVLAGEYEHPISKYIEETKKSSKQIAEEIKLRSEQEEKLKKIAELNKSLASSTADLHEQINKLSMDEQAYYKWKKQDLLQKGMDTKLVNEHIEALKGLAAAEEIKLRRSEQAEKLRKLAELNKSLASSTADLHEQINKLSMDEQAYYEWKKQDLLQKGMDLQLVNEHIEALKGLAAAEEEVRRQKQLSKLLAGAPPPQSKPSMSFNIPDEPTVITPEEEEYKRKLELAKEYYNSLDVYRSREIDQIIAIVELSGEATDAFRVAAAETAVSEQMKAQAMSLTMGVAAQAYGLMINQLALLAATGRFSAKAFIAAMMDIAAGALLTLGTEATVRAIMAYAKGLEAAAAFDPRAAIYFAAASMYTKVAIGAGIGAVALKAGAYALRGETKDASPVYNVNPYSGTPTSQAAAAEPARPQIVFRVEKMELLDEDSVDRLIARINERVTGYDVVLEAGA